MFSIGSMFIVGLLIISFVVLVPTYIWYFNYSKKKTTELMVAITSIMQEKLVMTNVELQHYLHEQGHHFSRRFFSAAMLELEYRDMVCGWNTVEIVAGTRRRVRRYERLS